MVTSFHLVMLGIGYNVGLVYLNFSGDAINVLQKWQRLALALLFSIFIDNLLHLY